MARVLIEVFRERRIDLYPHDELRRDLSRLSIKETGFGNYKLVAPRDKHSHCDAGVALSIALPFASTGAATGHRYMSVPLLDRIPVGD